MKIAGQDVASASQLADWIISAADEGVGELPPDPGPAAALDRAWREGDDATRDIIAEAAIEAAERGNENTRGEVLVLLEGKTHPTVRQGLHEMADAPWLDDPNPLRDGEPLGRALVTRLSKSAHQDPESLRLMKALAPRFDAEDVVLGHHLMWDPAGEGLAELRRWASAKRDLTPGQGSNLGLAFTMSAPDAAVPAAEALADYPAEVREAFYAEAQANLDDDDAKAEVKTALGL